MLMIAEVITEIRFLLPVSYLIIVVTFMMKIIPNSNADHSLKYINDRAKLDSLKMELLKA